jgi:hypothetical protein
MNRVVMPLFDFVNSDEQEFVFGDGSYALRTFRPNRDIPNVPGLSEMDVKSLKSRQWALVAEDGDAPLYKEDINRLLLSFKIHTLGKLFIKYRLCGTNQNLCKIIDQRMTYVRREKSPCKISLSQLSEVNVGFERLQEMDALKGASNRTHNAIFFLYCAYFSSGHASNLFVLLRGS